MALARASEPLLGKHPLEALPSLEGKTVLPLYEARKGGLEEALNTSDSTLHLLRTLDGSPLPLG